VLGFKVSELGRTLLGSLLKLKEARESSLVASQSTLVASIPIIARRLPQK